MTAGGSAAIIGNPTEVALVRMTLDGRYDSDSNCLVHYYDTLYRLPAGEKRGYKNALDAIYRISREEGIRTLWRVCESVNISIIGRM